FLVSGRGSDVRSDAIGVGWMLLVPVGHQTRPAPRHFVLKRNYIDLRQAAQKLGMNPSDTYLNAVVTAGSQAALRPHLIGDTCLPSPPSPSFRGATPPVQRDAPAPLAGKMN